MDKYQEKGGLCVIRTVKNWGNSLGVTLPKRMTDTLGIENGSEVEICEDKNVIVIRKARKKRTLEDYLAACSPENAHEEIEWGRAGKEIW